MTETIKSRFSRFQVYALLLILLGLTMIVIAFCDDYKSMLVW